MTTRFLLALLVAIAGCAGSAEGGDDDNCRVSLGFSPSMPIAGPAGEITVTATVTGTYGVLNYNWDVSFVGPVPFATAAANDSAIRFTANDPGVYEVTLDVQAPGQACPQATQRVTAVDSSGTTLDVRLHVTPPFDLDVPPIDRLIRIYGGTDYDLGPVVLEPGVSTNGNVTSGGSGVAAYVKLSPQGMAGAVVETFSSATGTFNVTLLNQPHDVIVVPSSPALAPQRFTWTPPASLSVSVGAGSAITGFVRRSAVAIAGAKVQLTLDGVPSTLGTTAGDGSFTVRGVLPAPGATVKVEVTPPAGSGLMRLESSAAFDASQSMVINYSSSIGTRNVAGTEIRRGGLLANRNVMIVGAIGAAGSIQAGVTANATGFARISTTSDGGGILPSLLAPAGPLSAVVAVAAGDLAVTPFDLSTAVPATINAPAMTTIATVARLGQLGLDGARLDLVPVGPLALAGAPTVQLIANASGLFVGAIPGAGMFDAYFSDPQGRSGQRIVPDVTATNLSTGASYQLDPAVSVSGTLSVTGNPNKIRGASVQILCAVCSGLDRDRPIAEVASDQAGDFVLAVPDPGTM